MKESLPPVHIAPILEGDIHEEFAYLREKAKNLDIRTIVSLRGGGALLPRILGCMPELVENGVLGQEPWGMVGTSTGAIAGFFARDIGFESIHRWHVGLEPIASFQGWKIPWGELTVNGLPERRPRKLNFGKYYTEKILPRVHELDYSTNETLYPRPALNMVVVTRRDDKQPYIYHDEHWIDKKGAFQRENMIRCVEGSCGLPFFVPTHDEHIGTVIDGGLNKHDLTAPVEVARQVLGQSGRIISIEPVGALQRGIHIEYKEGVQLIRIVMQQQVSAFQKARNILVFDPQAYEIGAKWGKYAGEVLSSINPQTPGT